MLKECVSAGFKQREHVGPDVVCVGGWRWWRCVVGHVGFMFHSLLAPFLLCPSRTLNLVCPFALYVIVLSFQLGGCQSFIWQQIICCHQREPRLVVVIITTQPMKADTRSLYESQPYCNRQLSLHQNISDLSDGSIQECLRVQTPFYLNHTLLLLFF